MGESTKRGILRRRRNFSDDFAGGRIDNMIALASSALTKQSVRAELGAMWANRLRDDDVNVSRPSYNQ